MAVKLDPNDHFTAHVQALLVTVNDPDIQAILEQRIHTIIDLADTNSQANRDHLIADLKSLIEQRTYEVEG